MDPELRAYLDEMRQGMATIASLDAMRRDMAAMRREMATSAELTQLQRRVATLQSQSVAMDAKLDALATRVDQGLAARKEDEDLALRKIEHIEGRVRSSENPIPRLEEPT